MIKKTVILLLLLVVYVATVLPLTDYMRNKPFVEKLGYIPSVSSLRVASLDYKQFVGASLIMRVLIYYGGLVDKAKNQIAVPVDYPAMSRTIHAALKLDPYNMDGYYFAQAILAWDVRQVKVANDLLEYGMRYRDWDWYLPFFAGFNCAYFLKDYENAAKYYARAAELSGQTMFMTLTGRYLQESGRTGMAIAYLDTMARNTRNKSVRMSLVTRKKAFIAVRRIEIARDMYLSDHGKLPSSVDALVRGGYLKDVPRDPYGGTFFVAENGKILSTSGFSSAGSGKKSHQ
jgi:tetratricopeptide (TPR) repeat protein